MTTDTTNAPEAAAKGDPIHQPVPLSEWIRGTVRLHFAHGTTVTRKMSLAEAQSIHQMLATTRSSDRLDWFHTGWIQFANDQVVASEFEADEDLGWPLTPEDRAALKGHPHGVLATLRDHWKAKGSEPSYSPIALWNLHSAALGGLTGNGFATLAEYYEGEEGDRRLRAAFDEYTKAQKAQPSAPPDWPGDGVVVDDSAAPDAAPEPGDATDDTGAVQGPEGEDRDSGTEDIETAEAGSE